jgi:hypothetical protein
MTLVARLNRISSLKFCFAKSSTHSEAFARNVNACSMHSGLGWGLGIPGNLSLENQIRAVFREVINQNGIFLFNINGVNLKMSEIGFRNFAEAASSNQITEWELFMILINKDYLKNTTFHNGKVQFKKRILWKSITH